MDAEGNTLVRNESGVNMGWMQRAILKSDIKLIVKRGLNVEGNTQVRNVNCVNSAILKTEM